MFVHTNKILSKFLSINQQITKPILLIGSPGTSRLSYILNYLAEKIVGTKTNTPFINYSENIHVSENEYEIEKSEYKINLYKPCFIDFSIVCIDYTYKEDSKNILDNYNSFYTTNRVYIFRNIDFREDQELLNKFIEATHKNCMIFLTASDEKYVEKAILSRCFVFKMKTNLDDLQYIQKNTLYFTENKKWIKEIKIPDNRTSSSFLELYVSQNINQSNFCFEKIEDIANETKLPVFYIAITAAKMMKHKFASMFERSIRATQNNKKITRLKIYLFANLLRIEEKNNE